MQILNFKLIMRERKIRLLHEKVFHSLTLGIKHLINENFLQKSLDR
jgi:hypothetical protein